jgi:hypothetical protein
VWSVRVCTRYPLLDIEERTAERNQPARHKIIALFIIFELLLSAMTGGLTTLVVIVMRAGSERREWKVGDSNRW